MSQEEEKLINDPIHGYMTFKKWAVEFIDTKAFQRLRDIKQLGASYFVFPGACHNRFEHSLGKNKIHSFYSTEMKKLKGKIVLGTAHLAYTLTKKLLEQPGVERVEKDLECVTLAALCHDLGHGPFSHVFDNDVIPGLGLDIEWKHEKGSEMMFDYLYDNMELHSIDLNENDLKFIKGLIKGDRTERSPYLFDIVSNKRNSVDVDKFDYLARDCYYLGMKSLFDSPRLMRLSYVTEDQIVYHHKESINIYEMFHTRYSLHKRIYNHRVTRAINFMIRDALVEANSVYQFQKIINVPEEYIKLNDSILYKIEYPDTDREELKKSQEIIERIRKRKLYKFVNECLVPQDKKEDLAKKDLEFEIASHRRGNDISLSKEDIIVDWQDLNYAKGEKNPVEHIKFYNKDPNKIFSLKPERISYLFPKQYEETIVRIFARDPEKDGPIQNAFQVFAKANGLSINEGFSPDEDTDFMDINLRGCSQDDKIKSSNVP
ncbi:27148_t:CDS:2 [Dentiscutata erythropus]|uniref:27148_t:CDS:1 n=1 Tax=Dentiscutata erythropus TaxID=1348616 RepID=A0A9N9HMC9_9GLOM|nr:27148_t:CDS:2 [Dentiscutata erythropus]